MSDAAFQFVPVTPASEQQEKPKRKRKDRPAKAVPVKQRSKRQPRALKLEVAELMEAAAMLRAADSSVFVSIVKGLNHLPAASRKRIVSALGKVFKW